MQRVPGHRGRLRRHRDGADRRPAPAAVLRGVDREPRAAHLPAARARLPRLPRARSRWPRDHRDRRRARPAPEEGRQRDHGTSSAAAPIHPVNVRVGGFYRAPTGPNCSRWPSRCAARSMTRWTPCAGSPASTSPTSPATTNCSRCAEPGLYAIERGHADDRSAAWRSRRARVRASTSIEEQVPHSTALHAHLAGGGRYLDRAAGPVLAQLATGSRRWPREAAARRRARRDLPQPVPQHRRARRRDWSTRSRRRCGSSTPTTRPSRRRATCRRAPASATA